MALPSPACTYNKWDRQLLYCIRNISRKGFCSNRWPSEEPSGHGKQTCCLVKVHPLSLSQSVTLHTVPPVLARFLSFSLSLSFCPLTSPSCQLLYSLQGLFLFSSLRSYQIGGALSVPSNCLHCGSPTGTVPHSQLQALPDVFILFIFYCLFLLYVACFYLSSSICHSALLSLSFSLSHSM